MKMLLIGDKIFDGIFNLAMIVVLVLASILFLEVIVVLWVIDVVCATQQRYFKLFGK